MMRAISRNFGFFGMLIRVSCHDSDILRNDENPLSNDSVRPPLPLDDEVLEIWQLECHEISHFSGSSSN
jgi:hypothetical protein